MNYRSSPSWDSPYSTRKGSPRAQSCSPHNHTLPYRIVSLPTLTPEQRIKTSCTSLSIMLVSQKKCRVIPGLAVVVVARHRKPQRNVQLERFCNEGISIDMLRSEIVKQALQQEFASRSRLLLQSLGLYDSTDRQ